MEGQCGDSALLMEPENVFPVFKSGSFCSAFVYSHPAEDLAPIFFMFFFSYPGNVM